MAVQRRISAKERERMIAEAAYYRAQQRSHEHRDALRDWLEAEAEIDAQYEVASFGAKLDALIERLHEANEHFRQSATALKAEATEEWREEIERAKQLRDALAAKLEALREETGKVDQQVKRQADKLWTDLSKSLKRLRSH